MLRSGEPQRLCQSAGSMANPKKKTTKINKLKSPFHKNRYHYIFPTRYPHDTRSFPYIPGRFLPVPVYKCLFPPTPEVVILSFWEPVHLLIVVDYLSVAVSWLPALSPFFFRACLVRIWWGHTLGSSSRSVCCACAPVCVTTHDRLCTPGPDEQVLPLITFAHHVVGVSA